MTFSFIFKTCSDEILAKLVNPGGGGGGVLHLLFFLSRCLKTFENEKNFLCLKIAEIDTEGQFSVEKNESGHIPEFDDLFAS